MRDVGKSMVETIESCFRVEAVVTALVPTVREKQNDEGITLRTEPLTVNDWSAAYAEFLPIDLRFFFGQERDVLVTFKKIL